MFPSRAFTATILLLIQPILLLPTIGFAMEPEDTTRVKSVLGGVTTQTPTTWYNVSGTTPTKHILLPDGEMLATVEGSNASASISYVHTDHLTGASLITNNSGAQLQLLDYHPFGTLRLNNQSSTFNEKRKFAGHEYDAETGLSYMQARYYESATGRFLSEDPAFLDVGDRATFESRYQRTLDQHLQNPQVLNSYAYALNNPFTYRDPQGEIVPLLIIAWAAVELGLSAYDAYSTYQTLQSSDTSSIEKAATLGGFAAGLALPGGVYGVVGKGVIKAVDRAADVAGDAKKAAGVLKGTQNPSVRDAIKYGQEQHRLYNPGEGFTLNKEIPGTRLRPDALNAQSKVIRELKPDTSRAIQRGQTQLQRYIDVANKVFGNGFRGFIDTYKKKG